MATVTVPTTSTLPVAGGDIIAAPLNGWITNLKTFVEGNNIDENNVDYSNSDGIVVMGQAQTITGLKSFENTSAAAGGVRTAAIFSIDPASGTPADGDGVEILFQADDDEGNVATIAELEAIMTDTDNGDEDSEVKLKALIAGSAVEFMVAGTPADGAGRVVFNDASADIDFRIETNNIANGFVVDAGLDVFAFGAAGADDKFVTISPPAVAHAATVDTYALHVTAGGAQTIPTGTTALVASVAIEEPNITATGTVTSAATLYIKNAPTEGGSNYALWVDDGAAKFDSTVTIADGSLTLGSTAVTSTAAELNLLDALDRGSILYGNASGVTTVLGQGGPGTVLTSDGTDISWSAEAGDITSVVAGTGMTGGATSGAATLNVIGGNGITANADDVAITAAQTTITSIYATDLIIGEDSETAIDFGTANEIDFKINNTAELTLSATALYPIADAGLDLGTSALGYNDLHLGASGVVNFDNANMTITHSTGTLTVAGGTFAAAAITGTTITGTGVVTGSGFTIGSAVIGEAELEILDGATVTTAELNLLDGLDRGSIIYGNASSVTTVLGQGGAGTVLTSDGTDISWAAATGGHTIEEEGSGLTQRTKLNFVGAAVTATDGGGVADSTIVTVSATGASMPFIKSDGTTSDPIALTSAAVGESLVSDTSPQLGGNLDVLARSITTTTTNGDIAITPHGTGKVVLDTNLTFDGTTMNVVGNAGVGIARTDGTLHVHTATAGTVAPNVNQDDLVVENSTHGGISILVPDASDATLAFGSASDAVGAILRWNHNANLFRIGTANAGDSLAFEVAASSEAMRIDSTGKISTPSASLATTVFNPSNSHASGACIQAENTSASYTGNMLLLFCTTASGTGFDFAEFSSSAGSAREFRFLGNGTGYADTSWTTPAADMGEYFESRSGEAMEVGKSVVLVDGLLEYASDHPLLSVVGVVRGEGLISFLGNNHLNEWKGRYLRDDFGSYVYDDDGKRIVNPDFDEEQEYVSYEDREEKVPVGLTGQIPIRSGEPVGDNWVKMKDITVGEVELWYVR
jgi:hypothetical protein|tara:strand:- start:2388 stop:5516 length:3129 start_codon:yes stop_codon:yes gene_type:complete